ncbi:MAG: YjbH domain-containing protein [Paracoccus sp. (in: a-proteobacteria)]|uniref:YjbH domain-containing protein n=1 Tax=Paracoccus sp. TaxID=267 RepID=UPI0026E0DBE4|nr:YjbH domain-containing protein [Paracoccus sp. (in: a-proteobacteria)]MDO5620435.1 YjbH domain-containing protein [Paracoccus sp. (in: a-proteobacteria)]
MRRPAKRRPYLRRLLATTLPAALLMASASGTAQADITIGRGMNSYGLPGAVDTPTAEMLPDATIGATLSFSHTARRNTLFFQALPRLNVALRYAKLDKFDDYHDQGYIWDRSLDLRYQLLDQTDGWRPSVAIGLQDFLGTGIYSGEYIVATKDVTPTIRATVGLGWGRLAGKPRPVEYGDEGGKPNVDTWFRGGAKPFASVAWQANDRMRLVAEYSNDSYELEVAEGQDAPDGHINLGLNYRLGENYELGLYTIGSKKVGAQFTLMLNPKTAPFPSGLEGAPAPVRPRPAPAADPDGWSGHWAADPSAQPAIQQALANALLKDGQRLESMRLGPDRAEVRIRNLRYLQQAEAVGRTARLMTRALPPSVETLVITSVESGMPASSVTLRRSDVERLENTSSDKIAAAAQIGEADLSRDGWQATPGMFPRFTWQAKPYFMAGLFDASDSAKYEIGGELNASYEMAPGILFEGAIRQRVAGTMGERSGKCRAQVPDDQPCPTTSDVVVRSDSWQYNGQTSPTIPYLTAAWYARPANDFYSRVTIGLLEPMYGGASGEILWKPVDSRLALGAEVNRVKKRSPEQRFGFEDYEVTTGFVSAYYDFGGGFTGQLDVGKYLAGDVGATVSLDREFANGWKLGAFVTKTDMPAEQFGEGSFDKGIRLSIPMGWLTGQPSDAVASNELHSLTRDGGAQVRVRGRLYERVNDSHQGKLYEGWGKFWR